LITSLRRYDRLAVCDEPQAALMFGQRMIGKKAEKSIPLSRMML
jgi:hypothetical protein